ncbi:hypothetical protein C8F04DRAFT_1283893, partial [Mycena alexandri]
HRYNGVLAKHIFDDDTQEQARYTNDPGKYSASVETRVRRLKKDYQKCLQRIGATGAGLDPTNEVRDDFPWWDELHGFWRELPNYNPVGVQSSEPGIDHARAAADLYEPEQQDPSAQEDEVDELDDDGRSATSRANDDDSSQANNDAHSVSSKAGRGDNGTETCSVSSVSDYEGSEGSPEKPEKLKTPPVKKAKSSQVRVKAKPAASGRDLGLAKANSSKSVVSIKKKPVTALERLSDFREGESARMVEKRKLQHTEEMERIKVKRMKYEVKLLTAQNEQARLNRYATSQSPRRGTRVLNLSSPSPSKSRARYDSALTPRPDRSHTAHYPSSALSRPALLQPPFGNDADLFARFAQSGMGEGSSSMMGEGSTAGFGEELDYSTSDFTSVGPTTSSAISGGFGGDWKAT